MPVTAFASGAAVAAQVGFVDWGFAAAADQACSCFVLVAAGSGSAVVVAFPAG